MTPLRYIVEPIGLLMTWQPSDDSGQPRTRRVVAEIRPDNSDAQVWSLRYLIGSSDLEAAKQSGFKGHPAFKLDNTTYTHGVRESLLRRLPPRQREDFSAFLTVHRLPDPFRGSELALLGYTGAKLPSDGFAFVPLFPDALEPCEFILEVAGLRHVYQGDLEGVRVGDPVEFVSEPSNPFDPKAIAIFHNGHKIGYVNRALLEPFHRWITDGRLRGVVERKNGHAQRPSLYVRVMACLD